MRAHGPDGRVWTVARRPDPPRPLGRLLPGRWLVEARTEGEVRRWSAASGRAAAHLVTEVALALRTGSEGPPGELAPEDGGAADEE